MLKILLYLAVSLPILTGCASLCKSAVDCASDAIQCHSACPGGPGEKECIENCKKRLAAARSSEERKKEDDKFWPKPSYEYRSWERPGSER
jgi:hypothetical protein